MPDFTGSTCTTARLVQIGERIIQVGTEDLTPFRVEARIPLAGERVVLRGTTDDGDRAEVAVPAARFAWVTP